MREDLPRKGGTLQYPADEPMDAPVGTAVGTDSHTDGTACPHLAPKVKTGFIVELPLFYPIENDLGTHRDRI